MGASHKFTLVVLIILMSCNFIIAQHTIVEIPNQSLSMNVFEHNFIKYASNVHQNLLDMSYSKSFNELPEGAILAFGASAIPSDVVFGDFDGDGMIEFATRKNETSLMIVDWRGLEHELVLNMSIFEIISIKTELGWFVVATNYSAITFINTRMHLEASTPGIINESLATYEIDNDGFDEVIFCSSDGIYYVDLVDDGLECRKIVNLSLKLNKAWMLIGNTDDDVEQEIVVVGNNKSLIVDDDLTVIKTVDIGSTCEPALADIDGDGKQEIACASDNYVYIFSESLETIYNVSFSGTIGISVGNVDQDQAMEVLIADGNSVHVFEGDILKFLCYSQTIPATIDFDSDGLYELALINNDKLTVVLSNGTKLFEYPKGFDVAHNRVYLYDLNEDGIAEAITFQNYWYRTKVFCYRLMLKPEVTIPKLTGKAPAKIVYEVSKYHTADEIYNILNELKQEYLNRVEIFKIGLSYYINETYKEILCIKITNGNNKPKPSILLIGAHHARELITAEAALFIAVNLTEQYGYDPIVTAILDNFDIYIVPVLNVGGHDYALLYADCIRKNLRPIDDDGDGATDEDPPEDIDNDGYIATLYEYTGGVWNWIGHEGYDNDSDGLISEDIPGGVDLNRNYRYSWSNEGSLGDPMSYTYAGTEPLSEPETQALSELMGNISPVLAISLHSGEEMLLFPWGTHFRTPFEASLFHEMLFLVQEATRYPAMQACALYEAPGAWDDDAYGIYGVLAFTPEIFYNESWLRWKDYSSYYGGRTIWGAYGYKWRFNPMPNAVKNVCNRTLYLFVTSAYWMLNKLKDTSPPNVSIELSANGTKTIAIIKCHDNESGIHKVIFQEEETKILIHNFSFDAWTTTVTSVEFKVFVKNRAGLWRNITVSQVDVSIIKPENNSWINSRTITVEWNVIALLDIDHFELYLDGKCIDENIPSNINQYLIKLPSEGKFNITVVAILKNGVSDTSSVIIYVDTIPPEINIISPANNTYVKGTITVKVEIGDKNIHKIELYVDKLLIDEKGISGNLTYTFDWDTTTISDGYHKLRAIVFDKANNSAEAEVIIHIDNTKPMINIISPQNNSFVREIVKITAEIVETNIKSIVILIDDKMVGIWNTTGRIEVLWNTTQYLDGQHVIKIIATDKLDNENSVVIKVIVDNTLPKIINIEYPTEADTGSLITVKANVTDELSGVKLVYLEYRISGENEWNAIEMTKTDNIWTTTITAPDKECALELRIRAIDKAGNEAVSEIFTCKIKTPIMTYILTTAIAAVIIVIIIIYYYKYKKK